MQINQTFFLRFHISLIEQKPKLVVVANSIRQPSAKDFKLANVPYWLQVFYMHTSWSSKKPIYYLYYHLKKIFGDYCVIYENGTVLDPSKYKNSPYANINEFINTLDGESSAEFRLYNDMQQYTPNVKQILYNNNINNFYCTFWRTREEAWFKYRHHIAIWQRFFVSKNMPLKLAMRILVFAIELYVNNEKK